MLTKLNTTRKAHCIAIYMKTDGNSLINSIRSLILSIACSLLNSSKPESRFVLHNLTDRLYTRHSLKTWCNSQNETFLYTNKVRKFFFF